MNKTDEVEIDLLRMCRHILSKWKVVILSGIVFAVLGLTYKYLSFEMSSVPLSELDKQFKIEREEKQPNGTIQKVSSKVSYRIYKEDYEARVAAYNAKLESYKVNKELYADKIGQAQQELDLQNDYLVKSRLYNAADDSYFETVYLYTIKEINSKSIELNQIENNLNPGVVFAATLVESSEFALALINKLKISSDKNFKTVHELVSVKVNDKNSFKLIVKADSVDLMKHLSDEVNFINAKLSKYCEGKYELNCEKVSSGIGDLANLNALKKEQVEILDELQNKLGDLKVEASSVVEPIAFDDYGKLADLESFKVKKLLLYFLAGLACGTFIPCVIFSIKYLFDGKLKDENYLTNVFDIAKVACIHNNANSPLNEHELKKLEAVLDYLFDKGSKTVAFVSSLAETDEILKEVISFISSYNQKNADIIKLVSPAEIKDITAASEVFIVERLDVSDVNTVIDEIKSVILVKEKIYGIVYA